MSSPRKFGALSGVFVPSVLAILGVIMYLRLPQIVGHAGLGYALAIVAAAHLISVTTGLSLAALATDKRVEAGGSYALVARSFGLPIGGTLGGALFVGLALTASLSLLGATEFLLRSTGYGLDPTTGLPTREAEQLVASGGLLLLTLITAAAGDLAFRLRYLVLLAVAASLVSLFLGTSPLPAGAESHLAPLPDGASPLTLFALFFPAVIGFEAGLSRAEDLDDPRRALPAGTLLAILVGLAVYAGQVVHFALTVPAAELAQNPDVLVDHAASPEVLLAGLVAATLSSALGGLRGAARQLQALALDRVAPRLLAADPALERTPRAALLIAFAVAELGVLWGSFDDLAAVITVLIAATYGVLNLACAVETWSNPEFRPELRIAPAVSLLGAAAAFIALLVLYPLPLAATLGAMVVAFAWLKRRQLALEGGDAWLGLWAAIARKALLRLSRAPADPRNWRPHVLLFTGVRTPERVLTVFEDLVASDGVMTEFTLLETPPPPPPLLAPPPPAPAPWPEGVTRRELVAPDPFDAILSIARYHGLAGYRPNLVAVSWGLLERDPDRAAALLREIEGLGRHAVLALRPRLPGAPSAPQLDVWWHGSSRNLALGLALVRFLTLAGEGAQLRPRFLTTVADPAIRRTLERRLAAWLAEARVDAEVRVLDAPTGLDTFEGLVTRVSAASALVLVGLGEVADGAALASVVARLEPLKRPVLLLRAEPSFSNPFPHVHREALSATPLAASDSVVRALPFESIGDPALGRHVLAYHDGLRAALEAWADEGLSALVQPFVDARAEIVRRIARAAEQLARAAALPPGARRRRLASRVERGLIRALEERLSALASLLGADAHEALRADVAVLGDRLRAVEGSVAEVLLVTTGRDGMVRAAAEDRRGDDGAARPGRGYVRWPFRRFVAALHAGDGRQLLLGALEHVRAGRDGLALGLEGLVGWSLQEVARQRRQLAGGAAASASDLEARVAERVAAWDERVAQLVGTLRTDAARAALGAAKRVATALADPGRSRRVSGAPPSGGPWDAQGVAEATSSGFVLQRHTVARSALDVALRGVHRDLEELAEQVRAELEQRVERGALTRLAALDGALGAAASAGGHGASLALQAGEEWVVHDQKVIARMTESLDRQTEALPETVQTLTEASFHRLAEGRFDEIEEVSLALRRLVAYVLKTELLGPLREALAALAAATLRASNAVREVARLVGAQGVGDEVGASADADILEDERRELLVEVRARLGAERALVVQAHAAVVSLLAERLDAVCERTTMAALGQDAATLERFIRTRARRGLRANLGALGGRARDLGRRAIIDLSYRWSRGVLLARRLEARPGEPASAVEPVLAFARAVSPLPRVREALPIFYRQVFLGRAAADPAWWLEAEGELLAAERAVDAHAAGRFGSLWITGPQGSGVGAVIRRLVDKRFGRERTFVVRAPEHGSVRPERFDEAVLAAVGGVGDVDEALATLPAGSAVVIDELELWWERSPGGLAVLERLAGLAARHGGRVLFILGVNVHLVRILRHLELLVDQALATVHCRPLDALHLREAILRRHDATGLGLRLAGDDRDRTPGPWATARLFNGLFEHSDGYIGAALNGWIAHITEVRDGAVAVRRAQAPKLDALDALSVAWTAVLLELVLHRRMDRARLARVTGLDAAALETALGGLARAGLLAPNAGSDAIAIDRFAHRHVERWLERQELL